MSAGNKFAVKKVVCDSDEIQGKTMELETQWLVSLLRRTGIPKIMIDKALDPDYPIQSWRDFLLGSRGLIVQKQLQTGTVEVHKLDTDTGEKVKVGQWKAPIVSRINVGGKTKCELQLKYWQIV